MLYSLFNLRQSRQWLRQNGIGFAERDIKAQRPTWEKLRRGHAQSGLPLKWFLFNTGSLANRALDFKERLPAMTPDERYVLPAADGSWAGQNREIRGTR